IRVQFDVSRVHNWYPSYNIAPTNAALMIYMVNTSDADYRYVLEPSKFGMIPYWAKPTDPEPTKNGVAYSREIQKHQSKYFNCRKETLAQSKSVWSSSRKNKRCVVPIQGYFEWLKSKTDKVPHYVHSKSSSIIYLAGLYSHNTNYTENTNVNGEYLSSFAIVTGAATKTDEYDISWLHSRKPIMLVPGSQEWFDWLDPNKTWNENLLDTSLNVEHNKAYKDIEGYPVSKEVGNPSNKSDNIIKREEKKPQKSITSFFSPTKRIKKEETQSEENSPAKKKIKTESNDTSRTKVKTDSSETIVKEEQ
ncbi:hypothetical protein PICST_48297, partial [Scheffersomyces stipitis CBS 6054]